MKNFFESIIIRRDKCWGKFWEIGYNDRSSGLFLSEVSFELFLRSSAYIVSSDTKSISSHLIDKSCECCSRESRWRFSITNESDISKMCSSLFSALSLHRVPCVDQWSRDISSSWFHEWSHHIWWNARFFAITEFFSEIHNALYVIVKEEYAKVYLEMF